MKRAISLFAILVFVAFAAAASANETLVKPGGATECIKASWIAYNVSETKETTLTFDIGPHAYSWGKTYTRTLAPGGYQTNAIAQRTVFKNKGPGELIVNCQRQRYDRNDWKIDAGSGKTYQSHYTMDHVQPFTYIEPGLGLPSGTERGIYGVAGEKSELNR